MLNDEKGVNSYISENMQVRHCFLSRCIYFGNEL